MFQVSRRASLRIPLCSVRSLSLSLSTRLFSQSSYSRSSHHDEEEISPDEHFMENPKYLFFMIGLPVSATVLYLDGIYREKNGQSFFAQFIHIKPKEEIEKDQEEYNERIERDKEFHEVLFLVGDPADRKFGRVGGTAIVPRGSPFNAAPGDTSIDVDNLAPRRRPRSIYD